MTHPSLDLTAFRFENDSPAAAHHPVPLHEVTWPDMAVFALCLIAVAAVGGLVFLGLRAWLGGGL